MQYYFLASALPELHVGTPPEIGFLEFTNLLNDNLAEEDVQKVRTMRRFYDLQNLRALWSNQSLDKWGNLDENQLDEALLTLVGFGRFTYIFDYLRHFEKSDERLYHFPQLVVNYFREEIENSTGFLHEYLTFEREWRLVLSAFRAKKIGRNLTEELQYEDPNDPIVAQILAQKDSPTYEPPASYSNLKPLFEEYGDQPFDLYQALCVYRFEKINELIGIDLFSIDRILAYTAQLIIVEKWLELDKKKGLEIVDNIVKEAS